MFEGPKLKEETKFLITDPEILSLFGELEELIPKMETLDAELNVLLARRKNMDRKILTYIKSIVDKKDSTWIIIKSDDDYFGVEVDGNPNPNM